MKEVRVIQSVKIKIIALVLGGIILSAAVTGGAGILNSKRVVSHDSAQIMNLQCANSADQIDILLSNVEQSVTTLSVYALGRIDSVERFTTDPTYVEQYSNGLMDIARNAAENTNGACAVYMRYNPELVDPEAGIFHGKMKGEGAFQELKPTNLSIYDPTDIEHVGWFYEPIKKRTGTWMAPYYNKNIQVDMISYVIPLYVDDTLIGVVGMDIDFRVIADIVGRMSVYKSGYAFLTDEVGNILYHQELTRGTDLKEYNKGEFRHMAQAIGDRDSSDDALLQYTYVGEDKKAAYRSVNNGMRLVLSAPTKEIDRQGNELIIQIMIAVLLVVILGIFTTIKYTRRLVRPLIELNEAAKKIAGGDLKVSITYTGKDEVGALAESFRKTAAHLSEHISYINELAYLDSQTGVKNKTAYVELVDQMDYAIRVKNPRFAVAVFDINGLKRVNDTYGHEIGDILIISACNIIGKTFKRSLVYRIGGDEFVVLLEDHDYDYYQELLDRFEDEVKEFNVSAVNELVVSIARGVAIYSPDTDLTYSDVFKRADHAMYCNKIQMKH